jgi:hypothetical protein
VTVKYILPSGAKQCRRENSTHDRAASSHSGGAALKPDGLIGIQKRAIAVERGDNAPVLAIEPVFQPERNDVVHQDRAVNLCELLNLFGGYGGSHGVWGMAS